MENENAFLLLLLFFFTAGNGFSQSDSITITNKSGIIFKQNGVKLAPRQLLNITKYNAEAYQEMKIAKSNHGMSSFFSSVGGFMVGYPMGTALVGGKPNWVLAGVGAGLVLISVPFQVGYTNHAKKAVNSYNNELKQTGQNKADLRVGFAGTSLGVQLTF